jgi:hypothetical protein
MAILSTPTHPCVAQKKDEPPVGFEVRFHGVKDIRAAASYDVDIRFNGAAEDWEYTNNLGIIPYSPEKMREHLQDVLTRDKIETVKLGDKGFVIVGYRTPDGKLNLVKSVKITPRGDTPQDKMPTIKDTRPKA